MNIIYDIRVHFVKCDVSSKDDWKRTWDEAEEVLGGKIEILCNNAGVPPRVCSFIHLMVDNRYIVFYVYRLV